MPRTVVLAALALAADTAVAASVSVNCNRGDSLNRALSGLARQGPNTVLVAGTCSEYVEIRGFADLTLKGQPRATLVQPGKDPETGIFTAVLMIASSRSVTIDRLTVKAGNQSDDPAGIAIGGASGNVRLRDTTVEGGLLGIIVYENSQVSLARVTARDALAATVDVYDMSDVHVEDCLFENTTSGGWLTGIGVSKALLTIHGTRIRNMQIGMSVDMGGIVDVCDFGGSYPLGGPAEVAIENPSGTNYWGLSIAGGSTVTLSGAKLVISNPGQWWGEGWWGGETGGVFVGEGSVLKTGPNLEISGSQGQGLFVRDNSHVGFGGSRITGSRRYGLIAVNQSTVAFGGGPPATEIRGSEGGDLFCDSRSLVTGGANVTGMANVNCSLLSGPYEPIP